METPVVRYTALLRGINLGRRRLKMDELRAHFEALDDVSNVATFIASGNVIFDSETLDGAGAEARIERHLEGRLGYGVDTFLRSMEELTTVLGLNPFPLAGQAGHSVHVIFLRDTPQTDVVERLEALSGDRDSFRAAGRQAYWLREGRLSDTTITTADLNRALGGASSTMRTLNTVRRLVTKFSDGTGLRR